MNPVRTARQRGVHGDTTHWIPNRGRTHQAHLRSHPPKTVDSTGTPRARRAGDEFWNQLTNREAEMGNYIVNGEIVDVREERPTAADLKRYSKSVLSDWVMASMPDG